MFRISIHKLRGTERYGREGADHRRSWICWEPPGLKATGTGRLRQGLRQPNDRGENIEHLVDKPSFERVIRDLLDDLHDRQEPWEAWGLQLVQREVGSYGRRIASSELVRLGNLWQILSESGRRVGVLNVPMSSYEGINGFMVPGFLDKEEGFPQPRPLFERLKRRFGLDSVPGDVEADILSRARTDPDILLERIYEITEVLAGVSHWFWRVKIFWIMFT